MWLKLCLSLFLILNCLVITSCSTKGDQAKTNLQSAPPIQSVPPTQPAPTVEKGEQVKVENLPPNQSLRTDLIQKFNNRQPVAWGENIPGILRHLDTKDKVIALTFDACGGPKGSKYDADIIHYLKQMQIPATLFINSRWIDANYQTFMALAKTPQFEIENHGYQHRPLSINGRSAWGIAGTNGVGEMVDEVQLNQQKIEKLTGKAPKFFRSGTAFYDDIGVNVVNSLGEKPVNYDVLGDAGATFTTKQVESALLSAKPGSIVILHMNQPAGFTAEGLKQAIPQLIHKGYRFVKLTEYPLK